MYSFSEKKCKKWENTDIFHAEMGRKVSIFYIFYRKMVGFFFFFNAAWGSLKSTVVKEKFDFFFKFKSYLSIFTTAWILFNNDISGYLGDNSSIGKNLHCQIVEIFCNLPNVIYWKKRTILAIMSKNLKNSGLSASLCRCWVAEPRRESVGYGLHLAFFSYFFCLAYSVTS